MDKGFHVIRLSKRDGGIETIKTKADDWIHDPNGNDVAVHPLELDRSFSFWSVETGMYISREIIGSYSVGLGDDAFLVGRLINHAGKQKNAPVARFGNISLMADPTELIKCEGRQQEGFLVECRSLSGFSGSPVFVSTSRSYHGREAEKVFKASGKLLGEEFKSEEQPRMGTIRVSAISISGLFGPWLLGIDWGHIPFWGPVYEKRVKTKANETGNWVEANSGIACVLPSWHILETLNVEELVSQRAKDDEQIAERFSEHASVNDSAAR